MPSANMENVSIACSATNGPAVPQRISPSDSLLSEEENGDGDVAGINGDDPGIHSPGSTVDGVLSKWTNYINGWQGRYFVLSDGVLSYYKSELESSLGCRGAINVGKALIAVHDYDECRFEISMNDSIWYLRTESPEQRQLWLEQLENQRLAEGSLRKHGSMLSLQSNKSTSSCQTGRGLKERLDELETFHNILLRQIDSLQLYFDMAAQSGVVSHHNNNAVSESPYSSDDEVPTLHGQPTPETVDLKGEALTFKSTTRAVIDTVHQCIELLHKREEAWKRKVEREAEKRRKYEEAYKRSVEEVQRLKHQHAIGSPDFEEGPRCALPSEEWHDALDAALTERDRTDERLIGILAARRRPPSPDRGVIADVQLSATHPLRREIDTNCREQLHYALQGVEPGAWELFSEDGNMRMYKRTVEIDGLVCDPLKAVHSVRGCTAFEYLHYFFEPEYKMHWDTTLDDVKVVEKITDDTIVFHQTHKRVWPAAQRESLFWSHMRRMPAPEYSRPSHDTWIVCNHDTTHATMADAHPNIRVGLNVAMICQTVLDSGVAPAAAARENITCHIVYVAQVNPGGWAPASILRQVYKSEYPKFLKRFTEYVLQKVDGKELRL